MDLNRIIICGGDKRSIYMTKFFLKHGINAEICGFDNEQPEKYSLKKCRLSEINDADAVIFGLPAVKNDMNINCPMCDEAISFHRILKEIGKNTIIAGGRFSAEASNLAKSNGFTVFDYSTDEVFQIENAFYTAEGAIEKIIKNTEKSISELKILILGYGRISKALCRMLSVSGSGITVYARNPEQRAWAVMQGCLEKRELNDLKEYDVIVNTVPCELLFEKQLATANKDVLIIDLSARPGYVNAELCEELNIKLLFLPGLPASSAPQSAGEAAARAVIRMCNKI